jgi:cathepsin B
MKFAIAIATLAAVAAAQLSVPFSMIDDINAKQSLWHAAPNHITAMTLEKAKGLLGTRIVYSDTSDYPDATPKQVAALPADFDSRANWPHCESISTIRDQRHCGSCWAFGAVEAMSDRHCIAHDVHVALSAEDMNSCAKQCGSCDGGYPNCAWQYWVTSGLVTEDCYAYTAGNTSQIITPPCMGRCVNDLTREWKTDKHFGANSYALSGEDNIMTEIHSHGPIEVAFTVYNDFMSYSSGIYKHTTGGMLGGHAVRMLGWGVDNGVKYWLCANSWNTSWGERGYFRIIRGVNECGIERSCWAGIPKPK